MPINFDQIVKKGIAAKKAGKLKKAEILFKTVLSSDKNHSEANHYLGRLAIEIGDAGRALPHFKKALEADPRQQKNWLSYIETLLRLDLLADANATLQQGKTYGLRGAVVDQLTNQLTDIESFDRKLNVILELYEIGNFNEALRLAKILSGSFSSSLKIKNILGAIYSQIGNHKEAADIFRTAIKQDSGNPTLYNNLGAAYLECSEFKAALETLKKGLVINPTLIDCYFNFISIFDREQNFDGVIFFAKKILKLSPLHVKTYYTLGRSFDQYQDVHSSKTNYKKSSLINPSYLDAIFNMGCIEIREEAFDRAIITFSRLSKLDPSHAGVFTNWGAAAVKLSSTTLAETVLRKGCLLEPYKKEPYFQFGNTSRLATKDQEAVKFYSRAWIIDPSFSEAKHWINSIENAAIRTAPKDYVQTLFDKYASHFENQLVGELHYQPKLLRRIYDESEEKTRYFHNVLDLGCGTGLSGTQFADISGKLVGIDLSEKMIFEAREKGVYSELISGDVTSKLSEFYSKSRKFDLFICGDVLVYVGDCDELFAAIRNVATDDALFVFSVEAKVGDGFVLQRSGRFAHSHEYIVSESKKAGFRLLKNHTWPLRKESGVIIDGGFYLLKTNSYN